MEILFHNLQHGITITILVFVMMMGVDYLDVLTKGKMKMIIRGGMFRQYITSSLLGITPGCLGSFMNVSFYVHGLISFGAITGGMIATCGDEAFIMLAMFPEKAFLIFGILFVLGVGSSFIVDKITLTFRIKPIQTCEHPVAHFNQGCRCLNFREIIEHFKKISLTRFLSLTILAGAFHGYITGLVGPDSWDWERITFIVILVIACYIIVTVPDHYLEEHIWKHIAKKHLWKIFLWSFGALLVVDIGMQYCNVEPFVDSHMLWVLLVAGFISLIPESGPHLVFVMMYAKGLIPFSVLLTSTIVQDGHGMLPLLSYSLKDFFWIKIFNLIIGLAIGFILFFMGY